MHQDKGYYHPYFGTIKSIYALPVMLPIDLTMEHSGNPEFLEYVGQLNTLDERRSNSTDGHESDCQYPNPQFC